MEVGGSRRGAARSLPRAGPSGTRLLAAGAVAFAAILAGYLVYLAIVPAHWALDPVDLRVYWNGGRIVRHVTPPYDAHRALPLYGWRRGPSIFKFTYPPFAAVAFAPISLLSWSVLPGLWVAANIGLLVAALWFTLDGLGHARDRGRLGAALLAAAAVLWMEPVVRTLDLGQVDIVLMALVIWDLRRPDLDARRWWTGAGVGLAAGIRLVPLIFIPYLVLTGRFRQALVAAATFGATVAVGFGILPADSRWWWLHGLARDSARTGFVAWTGNQSLRALVARLSGSVAGSTRLWLAAAVLTVALGLACGAALHRAGHPMLGLLACALTGLLASPVSWDHHWVWIAPAVAVGADYARRAGGAAGSRAIRAVGGRRVPVAAAWRWGLVVAMCAAYGDWPVHLWGVVPRSWGFLSGLIWIAPATNPVTYFLLGDRPWYAEYHWRGVQLLAGNAFVLGGLALFGVLLACAARVALGGLGGLARPAEGRRAPVARRPPPGTPAAAASSGSGPPSG